MPSSNAHNRKKRQGMRSYHLAVSSCTIVIYLEPNNNEIPETDHGELSGCIAVPSRGIFDRNDVHEMQDGFHGEETRDESKCIGELLAKSYRDGFSYLPSASPRIAKRSDQAYLPDEVVKGDYWSCDVQRRIQAISDEVGEGVFVLWKRCIDSFPVLGRCLPSADELA